MGLTNTLHSQSCLCFMEKTMHYNLWYFLSYGKPLPRLTPLVESFLLNYPAEKILPPSDFEVEKTTHSKLYRQKYLTNSLTQEELRVLSRRVDSKDYDYLRELYTLLIRSYTERNVWRMYRFKYTLRQLEEYLATPAFFISAMLGEEF